MSVRQFDRVSLIAYLAEKSPERYIGRTALMKYLYFLQTLRGLPLGYHFSLYSYGPFDSTVLSDLGDAESLGVVTAKIEVYSGGYGYRIETPFSASDIEDLAGDFLLRWRDDVDWVLREFGSQSAADLELDSTIVFTDREATVRRQNLTINDLANRVRDVKPHFALEHILNRASSLKTKEVINATL